MERKKGGGLEFGAPNCAELQEGQKAIKGTGTLGAYWRRQNTATCRVIQPYQRLFKEISGNRKATVGSAHTCNPSTRDDHNAS